MSATETWSPKTCWLTKISTLKLRTLVLDPQLREREVMELLPPNWEHHSIWLQNSTKRNLISVIKWISLLLELSCSPWELNIHLSERLLPKTLSTSTSEVTDWTYFGKPCLKERKQITSQKTSRISVEKWCNLLIKESIWMVSWNIHGCPEKFHRTMKSSKNSKSENKKFMKIKKLKDKKKDFRKENQLKVKAPITEERLKTDPALKARVTKASC